MHEDPFEGASLMWQVWVEKGFEEMYRRFAQTPGNTLSMQVVRQIGLCQCSLWQHTFIIYESAVVLLLQAFMSLT